jgi:hypothetical protein
MRYVDTCIAVIPAPTVPPLIRRAVLLVVALTPGCAPRAADVPRTVDILITGDSVGPVPAVGTRADVARAARVIRDTVEEGHEAIPESIAVLVVHGDTVRAVIDSGRVYRLSVTSERFRTADSLGPGTPLLRLLREPGVHAFTGEGAVYVQSPRHCGLSFRLADAGPLGDAPDSVGVDALGALPPQTPVGEVLVLGCRRATASAPST